MKTVLNYERFEALTGRPLGFYGAEISKEGELPDDFINYFKTNAARWDGQHLEVALSLLRKIDVDEARHLIADYLNHPLKYISLTVLNMLQYMEPIDEYILSRIEERLQMPDEEFGVSVLRRIRDQAMKKSVS